MMLCHPDALSFPFRVLQLVRYAVGKPQKRFVTGNKNSYTNSQARVKIVKDNEVLARDIRPKCH